MAGILPSGGQSSPQTRFGGEQGPGKAFQQLLNAQYTGPMSTPPSGPQGGMGPPMMPGNMMPPQGGGKMDAMRQLMQALGGMKG